MPYTRSPQTGEFELAGLLVETRSAVCRWCARLPAAETLVQAEAPSSGDRPATAGPHRTSSLLPLQHPVGAHAKRPHPLRVLLIAPTRGSSRKVLDSRAFSS